jgi:hypothetical protein
VGGVGGCGNGGGGTTRSAAGGAQRSAGGGGAGVPRYMAATAARSQFGAGCGGRTGAALGRGASRGGVEETEGGDGVGAAATATAGLRGGQIGLDTSAAAMAAQAKRRNNLTVPKSPNFSKMSWQKQRAQQAVQAEARKPPWGGGGGGRGAGYGQTKGTNASTRPAAKANEAAAPSGMKTRTRNPPMASRPATTTTMRF